MKQKIILKTVFAITLTILMLGVSMVILTLPAGAEDALTEGYYTYTVNNGEATIVSVDETISGQITIPSQLGGNAVTSIGSSAFYRLDGLVSVTIPKSIKTIENSAFHGCHSLSNITFEKNSTLEKIGENAFGDCHGMGTTTLTEITIPSSVKYIEASAFECCNDLQRITFEENSQLSVIGAGAFSVCSNLTDIKIPESVISIGYNAFINSDKIIQIENGVSYVDKWIIGYDNSLDSVILRDSTVGIADLAFVNCDKLTDMIIPEGVRIIGEFAFSGCENMETITISSTVKSIGYFAFSAGAMGTMKLKSVFFAEDSQLEDIGEYAFAYCLELKEISMPDNVKTIGEAAFFNCGNLTSITIPNSITNIGKHAFDACFKLVEIYNFSEFQITKENYEYDNAGRLGLYALDIYSSADEPSKLSKTQDGFVFYENGDTVYLINYEGTQTELILPDTYNDKLYNINSYAFWRCTMLTDIKLPNTLTDIGSYAFSQCMQLLSINIPNSVKSIGQAAFEWCINLESVSFADECLINEISVLAFSHCENLKSIIIPKTVKTIDSYAFEECKNLDQVIFADGNNIEYIQTAAFYNCSKLTSITIPRSIITIYNAFENCPITIYCYKNTGAHEYAINNSVDHVLIFDENIQIPSEPLVQSKSETSVILVAKDGYEYKCDNGEWQSSNVFDGLNVNRSYTFYQRIAQTDWVDASVDSVELHVTTNDHIYDVQNTAEKYIVNEATCISKAIYYYSCAECGLAGNITFENGEILGHTFTDWEYDDDFHWHICLSCELLEKHPHSFENEIICECGFENEPKLDPGSESDTETETITETSSNDSCENGDINSENTESFGCRSSICGTSVALLSIVSIGVIATRKKDD